MTRKKSDLLRELSEELKMYRNRRTDDATNTCIGVLCLMAFAFIVIQPYFEARSFNKLTGGNATYFDALFSELRIDGSSQVIKKQR